MKVALIMSIAFLFSTSLKAKNPSIILTLIPPSTITNKVDLDVRAGIKNKTIISKKFKVIFYLNEETSKNIIHEAKISVKGKQSGVIKFTLPTENKIGKNKIILIVKLGSEVYRTFKDIEVVESTIRSTQSLDGAWLGLYHWSEKEGKHWNQDIKKMTDDQWKELINGMHKLKMDIVVMQESLSNPTAYVGKHSFDYSNYPGKSFYPSKLYPQRMDIAAKDPIEAILSQADVNNMNVFVGVGMFAWFDFSQASLEWHKRIAKELWEKYGHHPSFYGFYVSEESGGGLDNSERTEELRKKRKSDIVSFFKDLKVYCSQLAPSKPLMLATNSMKVPNGIDTYADLLEHLDILCPFGFARMPKSDLTGEQSANILQQICDNSGSHLWFDLEAFLFNKDGSLYPRPIEQIETDLKMFDNFEKVLCYQFPGVFQDPEMSIQIGEPSTIKLFNDYKKYIEAKKIKKK